MPKGPDDYIEMDLSKLYDQEKMRKKMSDLAKENIDEGKSLNSPELLKESSIFNQLMVNEGMLKDISTQQEQPADKESKIADNKTVKKRTKYGSKKRKR